MIHTCGILVLHPEWTHEETHLACEEVHGYYRDRDPGYDPTSAGMGAFRQHNSHVLTEPPVKFMGLLDTVGDLGIPHFSEEILPEYQFYDQNVSWEVEGVFQALAVNDRLSLFTPCFARRKLPVPEQYEAVKYEPTRNDEPNGIDEVWFPGELHIRR